MSQVVPLRPAALTRPTDVLRKVPGRRPNSELRSREYLLPHEVDALILAAGTVGRHRLRDRILLLLMYRHGFRVSEAIDLRWDAIDFKSARMHVTRLKNGRDSTHFLEGDELRALRKLKRHYTSDMFVFMTERGSSMTRSSVNKIVERAGREADIGFPCHPHNLRHSCGFALANKGIDTRTIQDYLGHVSITHTTRYTQLLPDRFRGLWK